MRRRRSVSSARGGTAIARAMVVSAAMAGCNAIFGADEPVVVRDEPVDRDDSQPQPDAVDERPTSGECGDAILQVDEACDDGNLVPGDGCDDACQVECGMAPEFEDEASHHCYLFGGAGSAIGWEAAAAACAEWGGMLAAITSADELAFVQNRVTADTWINGRLGSGESYHWGTGEPWEFESWAPGGYGAPCVLIDGDHLAFSSAECDTVLRYLCERPPPGE
jgi:cysteine-rich repeat protein